MFKTTIIRGLILLFITSLITGCAVNLFPDKPNKLVIQINTSHDLNPDINGRPSPIVLYIYDLKSNTAFNNAPFFELYENSQETLGNDFVGKQKIEISPERTLLHDERELDMDTRYVGFLAAYRNLDNAIWRGSVETPLNSKTVVNVNLGQLTMTISETTK